MTEEKIFLVKGNKRSWDNLGQILDVHLKNFKVIELTKEEIERLKQLLSFAKVAKSNIKRVNKIIEFDKALLKKLELV